MESRFAGIESLELVLSHSISSIALRFARRSSFYYLVVPFLCNIILSIVII